VKLYVLMGGKRLLHKVPNQTLRLEPVKVAAEPPARLRDERATASMGTVTRD
jgi:hypothetical protein